MKRMASVVVAGLGLWSLGSGLALAETNCSFRTFGHTMVLEANCTTDATLFVPSGMTLEGAGKTITAVDPASGHFLGAVIKNAGPVAHVQNLIVDTQALRNVCDPVAPVDSRLRGILFDSASGSIVGNTVRNIRQGESGCQEGSGIEVRSAPFDGTHPATRNVFITGNRVLAYQKTGILVLGDVDAQIHLNRVTGLGPISYIAQNGVQLGSGARGVIKLNHIEGNRYVPEGTESTGILLFSPAPQTEVALNHIDECEVGVALLSTHDAVVEANKIERASAGAISVIGGAEGTENNHLIANVLRDSPVGIRVFGSTSQFNVIERNRLSEHTIAAVLLDGDAARNLLQDNHATDSGDFGFLIEGSGNELIENRIARSEGVGLAVRGTGNSAQDNQVRQSGALDIENTGDNTYEGNRCESSSGAPVDCP